jgi:hypothetical protein
MCEPIDRTPRWGHHHANNRLPIGQSQRQVGGEDGSIYRLRYLIVCAGEYPAQIFACTRPSTHTVSRAHSAAHARCIAAACALAAAHAVQLGSLTAVKNSEVEVPLRKSKKGERALLKVLANPSARPMKRAGSRGCRGMRSCARSRQQARS